MKRDKLFSKYYKSPFHDYEIRETLSYADDTGRIPDVLYDKKRDQDKRRDEKT